MKKCLFKMQVIPSANCGRCKDKIGRLNLNDSNLASNFRLDLNPGACHPGLDQKLAGLVVYLFDFVVFGVA